MLPLDAQLLRDIGPRYTGAFQIEQRRVTDGLGPLLTSVLLAHRINTRLRLAHFLGQCCEETAGFRTLEEFASGEQYEGRRDLGNMQPGDGKRFKGRGILDLTGRSNYERIGKIIGVDLINHPELAAEPVNALLIACIYWNDRNINLMADRDNIIQVTEAINGGQNGIHDRTTYTNKAKNALARIEALTVHGAQANVPGHDFPVLHRGANGPSVVDLQNKLSLLGFKIAIDGAFGPGTEKVVEAFQNSSSLDDDGIVGGDTWKAIAAGIASKTPSGTGMPV